MKKIQFFTKINIRNGFRGAQVKTWDYFWIINSHPGFKCKIQFHPESKWSDEVFWPEQKVLSEGESFESPDILLLKGGKDWLLYEKQFGKISIPVISPIVNYRVVNPMHPSHELLKKPAVRICPNPDLAKKLRKIPYVNGPVFSIPHGVCLDSFKPPSIDHRELDLVIVAIKNKSLGKDIYRFFKSKTQFKIKLLDSILDHNNFIQTLSQSKVCLHLPQIFESFYLPGLESMALGSLTVMPKCLGNEFYSKNVGGVFLCDYKKEDLINITLKVINLSLENKSTLSFHATHQAKIYSLEKEKSQWHRLLDQISQFFDYEV